MIPRLIHQFWDGGEFPERYRRYCAGWRDLHPGWAYRLWNLYTVCSQVEVSPAANKLIKGAGKISPKAPLQFVSDVIRYELLLKLGGIWIDVDVEPQKPLDDLCVVPAWICWEETEIWVNNAVMAAERDHPWVNEIANGLPDNVRRMTSVTANTHKSGPQYITPITKKWASAGSVRQVEIYPKDYFFPYLWNELELGDREYPDAYGIHRWNNRLKRQGGL